MAADLTPEPIVQAAKYTVNCLPEDGIDSHVFAIEVVYRGEGRWAVVRHGACLGADGTWADGVKPYGRGDAWLDAHRFDEQTALKLAKEHAPRVTVNGFTAADALRMRAERGEGR
jgi:hypothetical protein